MFLRQLGVSIVAGLVSLAAAATPGNGVTAGDSYERARTALEMPLAAIRSGPSDVGEYTCIHEGPLIHYNGATTLQLVNCLLEAPEDASRLVITSAGGNVDLAIFAAHVLKARELDVEVVGLCASSCANYLVPAARRVYLDRHSAILVHGAGGPPDRERLIEALGRSGFSETAPNFEQVVQDNLQRTELTYRLHNNFRREFKVGDGFYNLEDAWTARRALGQGNPSGMIRVDADALRACLPQVVLVAEPPDLEGLQALLPGYNLGALSELRSAEDVCLH
jgi:hypothetical protein